MAPPQRQPPTGLISQDVPIQDRLFAEGFVFDFFQAIRLLGKLYRDRKPIGRAFAVHQEIVRLRVHQTLDFPASTVHEIKKNDAPDSPPILIGNFLGLTGASGVLPRYYTETLLRLERSSKGHERYALRDWLDIFNHRVISLFYRAWEKYRFFVSYEQTPYEARFEETFLRGIFSFIGMAQPAFHHRLTLNVVTPKDPFTPKRPLAAIEDLSLLRYAGFFAQRPHNAVSLQGILSTYLKLPVKVMQFAGQWLRLPPDSQSQMGMLGKNNALGRNVVVGDRIWDLQSKLRVQLGPLKYEQFEQFLPDSLGLRERKAIFLTAQLIRLYAGPEFDVEIQLILQADEVPPCRLGRGMGGLGARLGWNTWSHRTRLRLDAPDAVFRVNDQGGLDFEAALDPKNEVRE